MKNQTKNPEGLGKLVSCVERVVKQDTSFQERGKLGEIYRTIIKMEKNDRNTLRFFGIYLETIKNAASNPDDKALLEQYCQEVSARLNCPQRIHKQPSAYQTLVVSIVKEAYFSEKTNRPGVYFNKRA
jgi:hypothetical protein